MNKVKISKKDLNMKNIVIVIVVLIFLYTLSNINRTLSKNSHTGIGKYQSYGDNMILDTTNGTVYQSKKISNDKFKWEEIGRLDLSKKNELETLKDAKKQNH